MAGEEPTGTDANLRTSLSHSILSTHSGESRGLAGTEVASRDRGGVWQAGFTPV